MSAATVERPVKVDALSQWAIGHDGQGGVLLQVCVADQWVRAVIKPNDAQQIARMLMDSSVKARLLGPTS